jgi:nucleoside-diphosphate-sugar epimerase
MSSPSLLIVGCGQLGKRVGLRLVHQGWRVGAIKRNPSTADSAFEWFAANYSDPGSLDFVEAWQPDYILMTPTPTNMDEAGYVAGFPIAVSNLLNGLGNHSVQRLLMVSSTRVYAEAAGGWVNEDSPLSATDPRALAIIEAEKKCLASHQPATIVRCGGIYGGESSRLLARIRRGNVSPKDPVRYTNRIHRDDAAGFLLHLLGMASTGDTLARAYNCVDDCPAPAHEVDTWLAQTIDAPVTVERPLPAAATQGHKRCSNHLLHATGYTLRYKDYREGYTAVLNSGKA